MASTADSMLYLYTSLTAGSSHIITATSRLETILKAHKIPFRALDCATDEKARTLWGRRAKGRKLPGLVKFGNVIADMDQVEEWNEFGELQDQIEAVDFAGVNPDAVKAAHPTATLPLDMKAPEPKSDPPSRASSQGRHISISEPTQDEIDAPPKVKSPNPIGESPMNMAMRQLGAEAAAKGLQRKTSGGVPKAAAAPASTSPTTTTQTPTPATVKAQEASEPADAESTAAKTPAVLAAEGKSAASTDKIEANTPLKDSEAMPPPSSFPPTEPLGSPDKSTEEQLLDLRRTSTVAKQPSRLSESTPIHESHQVLPEEAMAASVPETTSSTKETTEDIEMIEPAAEPAAEAQPAPAAESTVPTPAKSADSATPRKSEDLPSSSTEVLAGARPRSHRGSSVEEADKEEIKRIEQQMRIEEEDSSPEEAVEETGSSLKQELQAKDIAAQPVATEHEHGKGSAEAQPQETKAKDADAAGVSVGD